MQLELAFETRFLRELCESESKAMEVLGPAVAKTLQRRLADLRAANNIEDVVVGRTAEKTDNNSHLTLDLSRELTIVFRANHKTTPELPEGGTDWSKVTRIQITKIGDRK